MLIFLNMPLSPSNIKLTSTHYVQVLMQFAERLGLDSSQIREDLEIPKWALETGDKFVPNELAERLLRRLWRDTGDETIGINPVPLRQGSFALGCDYMITAASLGGFLRRGARIFSYLMPNDTGLELVEGENNVEVLVHAYVGDRDPARFLSEFFALIWHRLPCWAIDEKIELCSVGFAYPEPPHAHLYQQLFQCETRFDQPRTSLSFSARYLSRAIVRSRVELKNFLIHSPADFFYLPGERTSLQSRIKVILKDRLGENTAFPTFDAVCSLVYMSPQALRRRLQEEGTSYQKIKDSVRCDRVMILLDNPDIPVGEITYRVGFTEPAALSRAFKKWTNMTPAQYREQRATRRTSSHH